MELVEEESFEAVHQKLTDLTSIVPCLSSSLTVFLFLNNNS